MRRFTSFLLLLPLFVNAQYYSATDEVNHLFASDSASLHLSIDNYNFLWNNEFFGPIVEGYTLIGYNLQPALEYHFTKNIKAKAGVRLTKYSGLDKYTDCLPVYSVTWHNEKLAVTMGNINGASFHRLPEPILHSERQLTDNYENGMQVVYNADKLFADVWVDWQDFIFAGDNKKEKIFGGISVEGEIIKGDNVELAAPASWSIYHQGGQIDIDTSNMKLLYNVSGGLRFSVLRTGFVNRISISSQVLGFKDFSPTPESLYESGWGSLSEIKAMFGYGSLGVGYWYADGFLSRFGNPMYQCQSYEEGNYQKKRSVLTSELNLTKRFNDYFSMTLCAQGFYDTRNSAFDYTYAFVMVLHPDFVVHRFAK